MFHQTYNDLLIKNVGNNQFIVKKFMYIPLLTNN